MSKNSSDSETELERYTPSSNALEPKELISLFGSLQINTKMTQPALQAITGYPPGFHTSLLNEIPKFEGNPSELSEYIRATEDILIQFWQINEPGAYINKLLLSAARNRLKGAALEVVTGQTINSWNDLKLLLIENFGDQRSELNLKIDISRLKQFSKETPIEYFNRCRSLLAILKSKIALGDDDQIIKEYKITEAKNLTLTAYTSGLIEPLGSFIRGRAPQTLEIALTYVKNELDIRYFQNLNSKISQPNKPTTFQNFSKPTTFQNFNRSNFIPQRFTQYPQQNYYPPQFRTNQSPVYKLNPNTPPQTFPGFQQRNIKSNQNAFRPQRNFQSNFRPEPMETSTIKKRPASQQVPKQNPPALRQNYQNNFRPNNFIQQSCQPRNFQSQELHHTQLHETHELDNDPDDNEYPDNDLEYYEQSDYTDQTDPDNYDIEIDNDSYGNFRVTASE